MKTFIFFAIIVFFSVTTDSKSDTLWSASYSSIGEMSMDKAMFVVTDSKDNVIITGTTSEKGINDNITTIKYDKNGKLVWIANYNGPGNYHDRPFGLTLDKNDNILITGGSKGDKGTATDFITLKYSPEGNEIYALRFASEGGLTDEAKSIMADDLGNVYVTGSVAHIATSNSGEDWLTIKYDTLGNVIWSVSFDENISNDGACKLTLDKAGNVYVTGQANSPASHIVTIKYDSSGNFMWKAMYDGESNSADEPTDIKTDNEGNVYVSGHSNEKNLDWLLIKYDNNGNQLWKTNFNGEANSKDESYKMLLDGKGNIYLAGVTMPKKNKTHRCVIKFDNTGNILWKNVSENPISKNSPKIDMCFDESGNILVLGTSVFIDKKGITDMVADIISPEGLTKGQVYYDAGVNTIPIGNAIVTDSNGDIMITGYKFSLTGVMDYLTVKLKK
ncbi:MAG TPA: SBBP repeat-containing protein [Ignavibacteria bacterium]|nr:SBBP repeat-containing protein [Ignavibacteria bacterium]